MIVSTLQNVSSFVRRHKWQTGVSLLGALVFVGLCIYIVHTSKQQVAPPDVEQGQMIGEEANQEAMGFRDPLTGVWTMNPTELPPVFSVMIDHSSDAWPQAGIDKAFLVIEAPVEGGIPRLMTFYDSREMNEKIGPVRSARPYFIDFADEFDALYVHVGGSDAALEKLAKGSTLDLNQFWNGSDFWRSTDRLAPHNVYTESSRLLDAYTSITARRQSDAPLYGTWKFSEEVPEAFLEQANTLSVSYGSPTYEATWVYQPTQKTYARMQAGRPYKTEQGVQIEADTIAVLHMDVQVIDAVGRRSIQTVGEGEARVVRDGKTVAAVWKKPSTSERLRLFTQSGEELSLKPGHTWLEIVDAAGWETVAVK